METTVITVPPYLFAFGVGAVLLAFSVFRPHWFVYLGIIAAMAGVMYDPEAGTWGAVAAGIMAFYAAVELMTGKGRKRT